MKHFFRWIITAMLLYLVAWLLLVHAFGYTTVNRAYWLMYVVGTLVFVFILERRRDARPSGCTILAALVASGFVAWTFGWLHASWWVKGLLLSFVGGPLSAIANAAYRSDVRRAQDRRDQLAADLVCRLRSGDDVGPFVLYLRPFASTNRLSAQPVGGAFTRKVPVHLDLETLLDRSLRNECLFVALGCSGEMDEGAARVATREDDWRENVQLLARRATFVAMVPLSRPGTMWELEWLAEQGLLGKTLLIMPEIVPETPSGVVFSEETDDHIIEGGIRRYNADEHSLEVGPEWFKAIRVARGFGVELPPLAMVGALFTLDTKSRSVAKIVPLALSNLTNQGRLKYLRAAPVHFGLLPSPGRPELDLMREFRSAVFFHRLTFQYALIRAGDGYVVWGQIELGLELIREAALKSESRPEMIRSYLDSLPALVEERLKYGDHDAAQNYLEFYRKLKVDRVLSGLTSNETNSNTAALIRSGEPPEKL